MWSVDGWLVGDGGSWCVTCRFTVVGAGRTGGRVRERWQACLMSPVSPCSDFEFKGDCETRLATCRRHRQRMVPDPEGRAQGVDAPIGASGPRPRRCVVLGGDVELRQMVRSCRVADTRGPAPAGRRPKSKSERCEMVTSVRPMGAPLESRRCHPMPPDATRCHPMPPDPPLGWCGCARGHMRSHREGRLLALRTTSRSVWFGARRGR